MRNTKNRLSRLGRACAAFAVASSALVVMAPAASASVMLDQSSVTYNDTAAEDLFSDVNSSITADGPVTLDGSIPAVNPPNTASFTYYTMKVGILGTMYLGEENWGGPYFAFLPNSSYIDAMLSGTEMETFTFIDSSDNSTSTFTVTANGANDAPRISTQITDFTDGLPAGAYSFSSGSTPPEELVEKAFDGSASTKYLNFAGAGTDVLIDAQQSYVLKGFGADTANDSEERDPTSISIYGSNVSTDIATMEPIATGVTLNPPLDRLTPYPAVAIANSTPYRYYRIVFDTLLGFDAMQIGEIRLAGIIPSTSATYVPEDPATTVTGAVTITDEDTVSIESVLMPCEPGDALSLPANPYNSLNWAYDTETCTLSAAGATTLAGWNDAVASIRFESSANDPGATTAYRDLQITATDAASQSVTSTIRITFSANSIIYDANGATGGTVPVDAASPYATGATVTVAGNTGTLVRNGFSFTGWNTAADGTGVPYAPAAEFSIGNANVTLYAQWDNSGTPNTAPIWLDAAIATPVLGVSYSDQVSADGTPAATYSISDGDLPIGLMLDMTTGAITGTPTVTGPYVFEVTASNSEGSITYTFSGAVVAAPAWADTTVADMTYDMAFSDSVFASAYPAATYSITGGTLPAGLTLDETTGAITGVLFDNSASYSFEVTALNEHGNITQTIAGSITDPTPVWSDEVVANSELNANYSDGVAATSPMTITYSVDTGALPAGLALDATTGAITGVPTQAGSWSFSVRATIATHTPLSNTTVVTIEITDPSPIWTDQVLGGMTAGVPYSDSVNAASQYAVTYSVTAGALPTGLVLNSATGEITGTPATPGAYAFTILASSAGGDTLVDFAGSIAANPPVFFDSTVGSAQIAVSYSDGISASSYAAVTYAITAGSLPAGLVLDSTTGAITGTPTVVGSFTVTITATSDGGSAAITITITVAGDAPVWNDQTVSGGTAGAAYNDGVTTTSILPVTYSVTAGSLPAGLVLDPTTGAITGTPATAGTYTFTVTATSDAGTVSVELTIAVTAPAIDRRTTSVITGANTATLDFSGLTDATISVSPAKDTTQRTTGTSTVTNGIVSFTPDAGFSGKASVVVTIVRFGVTTTQTYEFTVIPAPATNVAANVTNSTTKWLNSRRANGSTVITWAASPNAVSYRVTVSRSVSASSSQANSTVLCSTTATSCALAMLLAEGTNVTVIAVGNDGTESVISTGAVRVGTAVVLSSMFRVDSWKLSATAKAELRALAATLKTAQATTITISGHGDARGGTYLNKWLSARRAAVVAGYLKAQLPGVKIVTKALGSSKPVASNDTAAGRALNRRAEITFR